MSEIKRPDHGQHEERSLTAAAVAGAAGGAASAIVQQGLAKLGSLGNGKEEGKRK
jgi:hypothetical protein